MKPSYRVTVDGKDITPVIDGRLIELTLTDKRGMDSDEVSLSLSDHDGRLALPRKGALITVAIGFDGRLIDKGSYTADEIGHDGPPDKLTVRARAADMRHELKAQKSRSFHDTTLGAIFAQIAADNGLTPALDAGLSATPIAHVDQTNESDMHFLTRLAKQYDALASIKDGRLLLLKNGRGRTAGGGALPTVVIARSQGDTHHFQSNDRDAYTGVKAKYHNKHAAKEQAALAGDDETSKTLPRLYANEKEAQDAADAEQQRLQRGKATLSLTLAIGRPELVPENPIKVTGFKAEIDSVNWIVTQLTHTLNESGLTTALELESEA